MDEIIHTAATGLFGRRRLAAAAAPACVGVAAFAAAPAEKNALRGAVVEVGAGARAKAPLVKAPPAFAPVANAAVELFVTLSPGDSLSDLLVRAGTSKADAKWAAKLLHEAGGASLAGSEITLLLGDKATRGRKLEQLPVPADLALKLHVGRATDGNLRWVREYVGVDATPRRFRGRAGDSPFRSLRSAGVPAEAARDHLEALCGRVDLGSVRADDRFDLVFDHRQAATEALMPPYAQRTILESGGCRPNRYGRYFVLEEAARSQRGVENRTAPGTPIAQRPKLPKARGR